MAAPSRRAARIRLALGGALGFAVGVVAGTVWAWDVDAVALLALLAAGIGYYLALWTVIVQATAAVRRPVEDDDLRNVPVGL